MCKKLKILYAEDDNEVAESIARMISLNEHIDYIDIAKNGQELIELYKKDKFDIVISDIQMPLLNGLDAIKEIKKTDPELFTVITTAFNEKDYLAESIDIGIDKYLMKPLDINKLFNIFKKYYEEKSLKIQNEYQKDMLILQSKAANLGFMIDAIAHQWKQPLNIISLLNSNIGFQLDNNTLDLSELKTYTEDIKEAVEHMTSTLGEFRSFSRPDKQKKDFSIKDCINKVQLIIKHELKNKNVKLNIEADDDFIVNGFINQFIHILLNFVSNSIDAFEENNIEDKIISIYLKSDDNYDKIIFEDNAGGIPISIVPKVFDMDFTTKGETKGTGIGLYLSNQIARNHNATLEVDNIKNGARFIVAFSKK